MSLRTQTDKGPLVSAYVTSFLLVVCDKTYLALPAGMIRGIIKRDDADKVDALAMLEVHTRIMDLTERLGLASSPSSEARILVCGGEPLRRAFLVTAIVGLEDIESATITPLLPHFTGPERQWFSGMFLYRESVALVLNPSWLLSEDLDCDGDLVRMPAIQDREWMAVASAPSGMAARQCQVKIDYFDPLELEEASDADDIPWAQL